MILAGGNSDKDTGVTGLTSGLGVIGFSGGTPQEARMVMMSAETRKIRPFWNTYSSRLCGRAQTDKIIPLFQALFSEMRMEAAHAVEESAAHI